MSYQNNWRKHRNPQNYCSKCGKYLTATDKGRSHDYGLLEDRVGYPRPLCYNHAYFFASKYIEEHLEELINKKIGKSNDS